MRKINFFHSFAASLALWTEEARRIPIGGQAVIEGVLMKGRARWALSVRKPDGSLHRESWLKSSRAERRPWKFPLLRGMVIMVEMMATGFKALNRSAEIALEETQEKITLKDLLLIIATAFVAVAGLFIALPLWLSDLSQSFFGLLPFWRNLLEGLIRGGIFVGYVAVIGIWEDIRQVFRYHGAEHKTINAFEEGLEMTPEKIAGCSRIHPRCGTSFLLIAVIVSIFIFSFLGGGGFLRRLSLRLITLPLVIGLSYEIIRAASRSGAWGKTLISPALSLQYLTTREPDASQIEVALESLKLALGTDDETPSPAPTPMGA